MSTSMIGKLETSTAPSAPSQDAFRTGILNALDITLSDREAEGVRSRGARYAAVPDIRTQGPYNAAVSLARSAKRQGRESELLVPGVSSMDADPRLAAAYSEGWSIAQRRGPTPPVVATGSERWAELARESGFIDGQNALSLRLPVLSGSWLSQPISLPVVGTLPGWGVAVGIAGVSVLAGYYFTKHYKRSAFSI